MSIFFGSTSSSSCLLSSLKIATRQKVGESTETGQLETLVQFSSGQLETLVYNKCFFFSESVLHEPFDSWGGYREPEVLVNRITESTNLDDC